MSLVSTMPVGNTIAICQNIPIDQQLEIGVRYLDIRCRIDDERFLLHHGPVYQNMNFADVLMICSSFLTRNPSEVIIMKVQEEMGRSQNFASIFNEYIQEYNELFHRNSTNRVIPTLGESRGKIILMKRFTNLNQVPLGIALGETPNAGGFSTLQLSPTEFIKSQSIFSISHKRQKARHFLSQLDKSFDSPSGQAPTLSLYMPSTVSLFINNTSAYKVGNTQIKEIANYMEEYLGDILPKKGKGCTGIVPMDFVSASACKAIIDTNFE